ncbi:MAG: DUF3796 domain-containing protein [Oscillospiraceae bacterium]|nr:DUF3796 domain-containing protein [Oscillospiraceae bacterium]
MKNKLAYLGFLGLVGIGGFITGDLLMFSFFAFFVFFTYANVVPDELFWENVKRAALRAFIVQMVVSSIAVAVGPVMPEDDLALTITLGGLALAYSFGIMVFALGLAYYEHKEKKGNAQ